MSEYVNGHTILVVEDSEMQREILKRILMTRGFNIKMAQNGVEGIEMARSAAPQLIISDVVMPMKDGYQMCREIKSDPALAATPLILLTQLGEPEEVIYGLEAGADNYLTKPFNADYLLSKIDALLNQSQRFWNNPQERCVEFDLGGAHYKIHSSRVQTLNFLLSTYENVVQRNIELYRMQIQLAEINEQLDQKVKQRTAALAAEIAERRAAEETLRAMADSAHDAIINTDERGMVIFWSSAAEQMFGFRAEEMLGNDISRIFSANSQGSRALFQKEPSSAGRERWTGEAVMLRKDGSRFHGELSLSAFQSHGKQFRVAIVRDNTERIQWETSLTDSNEKLTNALAHLQQTQRMLVQSEKMAALGRLAAGVAHEIKNPLNIISTSVQLLQMDGAGPGEEKNSFPTIMDQIRRSLKILDNLRDFAREGKAEKSVFELHDFLERTIALVEYEMKLDNVTIVKQFAPGPITVNADRDQLAQVFLNIINNARESMIEKQERTGCADPQKSGWQGALTISTAQTDNSVSITFRDTGVGAAPETLQKVFDPFYTTKAERNGTGLGLSIAMGIIESHGGSIAMEAREGDGAAVNIQLPLDMPA
ncbi:MAG: response regulator [Nitrospinae bacterium]|nr:response regulator [Nitrospinota bacterium]